MFQTSKEAIEYLSQIGSDLVAHLPNSAKMPTARAISTALQLIHNELFPKTTDLKEIVSTQNNEVNK